MDTKQYNQLWESLNKPMHAVLVDLRAALLAKQELAANFSFGEVETETDSDDFFVGFVIEDARAADKPAVVAVQFGLRDDDAGANIRLAADDIRAQTTEFSYIPFNFTPDVFTFDLAELQSRVEDVPLDHLVELTEKLLQKLLSAPVTA